MVTSSLRPRIPPASLIALTSSSTAALSPSPSGDRKPVTGTTTPIFTGPVLVDEPASAAVHAAVRLSAPAAATAASREVSICSTSL